MPALERARVLPGGDMCHSDIFSFTIRRNSVFPVLTGMPPVQPSLGNCVGLLQTWPENSVDSIATDPTGLTEMLA